MITLQPLSTQKGDWNLTIMSLFQCGSLIVLDDSSTLRDSGSHGTLLVTTGGLLLVMASPATLFSPLLQRWTRGRLWWWSQELGALLQILLLLLLHCQESFCK